MTKVLYPDLLIFRKKKKKIRSRSFTTTKSQNFPQNWWILYNGVILTVGTDPELTNSCLTLSGIYFFSPLDISGFVFVHPELSVFKHWTILQILQQCDSHDGERETNVTTQMIMVVSKYTLWLQNMLHTKDKIIYLYIS